MSAELDGLLRDYLEEERGPHGTRAKLAELSGSVQQHLVDDERRHGEVMGRLENHEQRIAQSEGRWRGVKKLWIGAVLALVSASAAAVAKVFGG